mgnify:CR=1 FL=1
MIKAIIFDMDGLMVDTETLYVKVASGIARKKGKRFTLQLKRKMMGRKAIDALKIFKRELGFLEPIEEIIQEREKTYGRLLSREIRTMPGLFNLLKRLEKTKIKKAIASSSALKWIQLILKKLKISKKFDVIVSGDGVKKGKPDPEIYLLTAKKLRLKPEECLVLEDNPTGVKAAKRAGMKCIAVPNKFTKNQKFSRVDLKVKSLNNITLKIIKTINKIEKHD